MDTKPKISPSGTYVLDEEDIEQLDELSLTSLISAVVEDAPQHDPEPKPSGIAAPSDAGDTTINKILGAPSASDDQQPGFPAGPEPTQTAGDLIAPELVFPELTPRRR